MLNSLIKIAILVFLIAPTIVGSLIWAGISSGIIWGTHKIDEKTGAEIPLAPSIISLVVSVLILAGGIYGTVYIINI